jgi:hypothetical protein
MIKRILGGGFEPLDAAALPCACICMCETRDSREGAQNDTYTWAHDWEETS